jgi:two-component system, NarL family, nitrate/nitrite response regulator NarL
MNEIIRLAILDDHQAVMDGYLYRLSKAEDIQVIAQMMYGEEVEPALQAQQADILILDISVPTSPTNPNSYPILYLIPRLIEKYPDLSILVISMHSQRSLVRLLLEAGANGYILKDDRSAIMDLPAVIRLVHKGGIYFSQKISEMVKSRPGENENLLTPRQLEVLSYCAAYPEISTSQLATQLNISPSTVRNLLSGAYLRLEVPNRSAAIARAHQLQLISPE